MNICEALVSIRELASTKAKRGIVPLSKSAIYEKVARGEFPHPIKLGPRKSMWDRRDIEAWLETQKRGGVPATETQPGFVSVRGYAVGVR